MKERTSKDRIKGSLISVKSIQAQINATLITMHQDFLVFIHITLFEDVVVALVRAGMVHGYKALWELSISICVAVALARAGMVHGNKVLWELSIYKKQVAAQEPGPS